MIKIKLDFYVEVRRLCSILFNSIHDVWILKFWRKTLMRQGEREAVLLTAVGFTSFLLILWFDSTITTGRLRETKAQDSVGRQSL